VTQEELQFDAGVSFRESGLPTVEFDDALSAQYHAFKAMLTLCFAYRTETQDYVPVWAWTSSVQTAAIESRCGAWREAKGKVKLCLPDTVTRAIRGSDHPKKDCYLKRTVRTELEALKPPWTVLAVNGRICMVPRHATGQMLRALAEEQAERDADAAVAS
jgi:hypothetical protein